MFAITRFWLTPLNRKNRTKTFFPSRVIYENLAIVSLTFRVVTRQKLSIPQNTSKLITLTLTVSPSASVHGKPGGKHQLMILYYCDYLSLCIFREIAIYAKVWGQSKVAINWSKIIVKTVTLLTCFPNKCWTFYSSKITVSTKILILIIKSFLCTNQHIQIISNDWRNITLTEINYILKSNEIENSYFKSYCIVDQINVPWKNKRQIFFFFFFKQKILTPNFWKCILY